MSTQAITRIPQHVASRSGEVSLSERPERNQIKLRNESAYSNEAGRIPAYSDDSAAIENLQVPSVVTGPWRVLYVAIGWGFVGLAFLGAMLPLLPATPFLLLASYFFVRSSPRLHRWLMQSRLFGTFLRDWQERGGIRPSVKVTAITMMLASVAASIWLGNLSWPLVGLLVLLAGVGMTVVIRLPVVRDGIITRST